MAWSAGLSGDLGQCPELLLAPGMRRGASSTGKQSMNFLHNLAAGIQWTGLSEVKQKWSWWAAQVSIKSTERKLIKHGKPHHGGTYAAPWHSLKASAEPCVHALHLSYAQLEPSLNMSMTPIQSTVICLAARTDARTSTSGCYWLQLGCWLQLLV